MSEYYIRNGELYHHGVKGMKWGVRRYQNPDGTLTAKGKKRVAKEEYKRAGDEAFKRYEKSINSIEKNYKRGQNLSDKDYKREQAVEKRFQSDMAKAKTDYKQAKSDYKQAVKDRKEAIRSTYKDLNKKATIGEKLLYNEATRKQAAKYIVDKNMSVEAATKKANGEALRNTAIFCAAYGAVTLATLYGRRG